MSLQMTLGEPHASFKEVHPIVRGQTLAATSFSRCANRSLCHSDLSHEDSSSGQRPLYATGEEGLCRRRRASASGSGVLGSSRAATSFSLWVNRSLCQSDLSHEQWSSGNPAGEAAGERQRARPSASGVLGVSTAADAGVSSARAPRILAAASSERRTSKAPPTLLASTRRSVVLSASSSLRTSSNRPTRCSLIPATLSSHSRRAPDATGAVVSSASIG
jgi:hypothetical protein